MTAKKREMPKMFDDGPALDPAAIAIGKKSSLEEVNKSRKEERKHPKVKVGFSLPARAVEQFDGIYLRLRLEREPISHKNELLELALDLLAEDIAKGDRSEALRRIRAGK